MNESEICRVLLSVIISLIVLCLFYLKKSSGEHMRGTDAYSGGATQRHASEITGTDQRPYSIPSNSEIRDAGSMAVPQRGLQEDFANLEKYTKQEEILSSYLYGGNSETFVSPATLVKSELQEFQ